MQEARAAEAPAIDGRLLIRRLAQERARRRMTQAEVAERMGTSQPAIARLEAAAVDPKLSTVLRYAAIVVSAVVFMAILSELGEGSGSS